MNRRDFSTAFSTLVSLGFVVTSPNLWAQPVAKLVALRTWPANEYVRVTLEYEGTLAYTSVLTDTGAPRLVVDLEGLPWSTETQNRLTTGLSTNPFIERVRAAQHGTGVRMVLDLKRTVTAKFASVEALGAYKKRLLIDVYPDNSDLMTLWLARQAQTEPLASSAPGAPVAPARLPKPTDSDYADNTQSSDKSTSTQTSKPDNKLTASTPPQQANKPPVNATNKRPKIIAIDAGHGGEDPGAIGPAGTKEKDIVLSMALQLAQRMRKTYGWQVVLTRDGDYFVPLAQRVNKARAAKADLFVSLHADAFISPTARGASVFALSTKGASSAAAKWLANKENDADLVGGLNLSDKDKQLSSVLLDMSTTAQIRSSLKLGGRVLSQLASFAHLHKNQVEQAGFAVLKAPDVPSVLIETAFISHPDEEKLLTDVAHQAQLVRAIAKAIAT